MILCRTRTHHRSEAEGASDRRLLWQTEGLNAPRKVTDATRAYLLDEDSVTACMAETCWVGSAYAPSD